MGETSKHIWACLECHVHKNEYLNANRIWHLRWQFTRVYHQQRQGTVGIEFSNSHLEHALHLLIVHPHDKHAPSNTGLLHGALHKTDHYFPKECIGHLRNRRLTDEKTQCNSCKSNNSRARSKAKWYWFNHIHTDLTLYMHLTHQTTS